MAGVNVALDDLRFKPTAEAQEARAPLRSLLPRRAAACRGTSHPDAMHTQPQDSPPPTGPSTEMLLARVLSAVESSGRRGRFELIIAILLALTSLASTWCGYQASNWGSSQLLIQDAADSAERQAAEDTIVALQLRTFDGISMLSLWEAIRNGDESAQRAHLSRMRPQLRLAIEAALADGVLTDPTVPGPLQRPEYHLAEEESAKAGRAEAARLRSSVQVAGRASADYILLTLMFASVLFFGGVTGTLGSPRARRFLGGAAVLIFVIAIVRLTVLPVSLG